MKPIKTKQRLDIDWETLARLSQCMTFDPGNGDMTLRNGDAVILLRRDGTIRIKGSRLIQHSDGELRFHAATIDVN